MEEEKEQDGNDEGSEASGNANAKEEVTRAEEAETVNGATKAKGLRRNADGRNASQSSTTSVTSTSWRQGRWAQKEAKRPHAFSMTVVGPADAGIHYNSIRRWSEKEAKRPHPRPSVATSTTSATSSTGRWSEKEAKRPHPRSSVATSNTSATSSTGRWSEKEAKRPHPRSSVATSETGSSWSQKEAKRPHPPSSMTLSSSVSSNNNVRRWAQKEAKRPRPSSATAVVSVDTSNVYSGGSYQVNADEDPSEGEANNMDEDLEIGDTSDIVDDQSEASESSSNNEQEEGSTFAHENAAEDDPVGSNVGQRPQLNSGQNGASPTPQISDELLVQARPIADDTGSLGQAEAVSLEELEKQLTRQRKARECRRIGYALIATSCLIVTLAVVFGRGTPVELAASMSNLTTDMPTNMPTNMPSSSPTVLIDEFPDWLEGLDDLSSPQHKAHQWVSEHPDISKMPNWRRLQLFALATWYYVYNGDAWKGDFKTHWLEKETHECYWFSLEFGEYSFGLGEPGAYAEHINASEKSICDIQEGNYTVFSPIPKQPQWESSDRIKLPQELSLLTKLRKIQVSNNDLGASLLDIIQLTKAFPDLAHLELDKTSISGSFPTTLSHLEKVSHLSLNYNHITGVIPAEISGLTSLTTLDVYENDVRGPLPDLGDLTSLRGLQLWGNSLSSTLPAFPLSMEVLNLRNNTITGQMPSTLFTGGRNLIYLVLDDNQISGTLSSEIGFVTTLNNLELNNNILSGSIPTEVGLLGRLKYFYVSNNRMTGSIPTEIGLTNLFWLLANGNTRLTGSIPTQMANLRKLSRVLLSDNKLSASIPSQVGLLTSLETFSVANNSLTGTLPSELGMIAGSRRWGIKNLDFSLNSLSGLIPSELGTFSRIRRLDVSFNRMQGRVPSELGKLPDSCNISLTGNSFTGILPQELCPSYCSGSLDIDCSNVLQCPCNCR